MTTIVIVWQDSMDQLVKTVSTFCKQYSSLKMLKVKLNVFKSFLFDLILKKPFVFCEFYSLDIDECAAHPCQNNGTCTDLINDYQCHCIDGFNGTNCMNSKLVFVVRSI